MEKSKEKDEVKFTRDQLDKALRDVHDLFTDRCLILNFLVLNDTAKTLREGDLNVSKIEVGLERKYLTDPVKGSFELNKVEAVNPTLYRYEVGGVPIKIRIIEGTYPFFENPDFVFYMGDTFYFGNPWKDYWEKRDLIK